VLHKGLKDFVGAEKELRLILAQSDVLGGTYEGRDLHFQTVISLVGLLSRTERLSYVCVCVCLCVCVSVCARAHECVCIYRYKEAAEQLLVAEELVPNAEQVEKERRFLDIARVMPVHASSLSSPLWSAQS